MSNYYIKLFSELNDILHKLTSQSYEGFHVSYDASRPSFVDIDNYPEDFQCFYELKIEQIGFMGYLLLGIERPSLAHVSEVYSGYIDDSASIDDSLGFGAADLTLKDFLVVGHTAHAWHVFGFDIRSLPYKFVDTLEFGSSQISNPSFTEMLVTLFEENLNLRTTDNVILFPLKEWCNVARMSLGN